MPKNRLIIYYRLKNVDLDLLKQKLIFASNRNLFVLQSLSNEFILLCICNFVLHKKEILYYINYNDDVTSLNKLHRKKNY